MNSTFGFYYFMALLQPWHTELRHLFAANSDGRLASLLVSFSEVRQIFTEIYKGFKQAGVQWKEAIFCS